MSETPRVEAFIQAKQDQVLTRGIEALTTARPEDVRGEVHRLLGTLGTYGLTDAVDLLRPLDGQLKAEDSDAAGVEAVRVAALEGLVSIAQARTGGTS